MLIRTLVLVILVILATGSHGAAVNVAIIAAAFGIFLATLRPAGARGKLRLLRR
jgi:hypothetical protein